MERRPRKSPKHSLKASNVSMYIAPCRGFHFEINPSKTLSVVFTSERVYCY
jgi:hypothetical protein